VGFGDDEDAYARPAKPNPMMNMMQAAMRNMQQQQAMTGGSGSAANLLPNNPMAMAGNPMMNAMAAGGGGGNPMMGMMMPQMTPEMVEFAKKMFEQRQEIMREFASKGGNNNPDAVKELMQKSTKMQQTAMAEMKRMQSGGGGAIPIASPASDKPALMTASEDSAALKNPMLPPLPSVPSLAHPGAKSGIDDLLKKSAAETSREDEEKRILAAIEAKDYSQLSIVKATQYGVLDRVRDLIEQHGYDPNKPDDENVYLLHWAAINNRMEIADYLLKAGARIDPIGGELESSPLNWAARSGHVNMVSFLMRHGANPLLHDIEGFSTLHLATMFSHSNVVAYLLVKGVDVSFCF
jgi:hypothetical protein